MNQRRWIAIVVGGVLVLMLLGASVILQATALTWELLQPESEFDSYDSSEEFVDQQIEAGFGATAIDVSDPLLAQRKVLLSHAVNARTARHVSSKLLYLDSLDSEEPIDLLISTPGGYVDSAFAIIDAINLIEAPVNTWAVGGCYSAGAMILTAGTGTRYSTDNAIIMVHANLEQSNEAYSYDRIGTARYERLFRETASLPESWFPMTDRDDTYYLSPAEAAEFGLIDEIVAPVATD